jgi:hypothetical protein
MTPMVQKLLRALFTTPTIFSRVAGSVALRKFATAAATSSSRPGCTIVSTKPVIEKATIRIGTSASTEK